MGQERIERDRLGGNKDDKEGNGRGQEKIEIDRLGGHKDDKEEKGAGQDKSKQIKYLKG